MQHAHAAACSMKCVCACVCDVCIPFQQFIAQVAMAAKKARGGARRAPVPDVEPQVLFCMLDRHVVEAGKMKAFSFGVYDHMSRSQAACASGLVGSLDATKHSVLFMHHSSYN